MSTVRFSASLTLDESNDLVLHAIKQINGNNADAVIETLLAKAQLLIHICDSTLATVYPRAANLLFESVTPEWHRVVLRSLFGNKKTHARIGFRHGFIAAYPSAFKDGLMLAIDAEDFTPPYTMQAVSRRAAELIEDEKYEDLLDETMDSYCASREIPTNVQSENEDYVRIHQEYNKQRIYIEEHGFICGFNAAISMALSESFDIGREFRIAIENNGSVDVVVINEDR